MADQVPLNRPGSLLTPGGYVVHGDAQNAPGRAPGQKKLYWGRGMRPDRQLPTTQVKQRQIITAPTIKLALEVETRSVYSFGMH